MEDQKNFHDEIEQLFEGTSSSIDHIDTRVCESEKYEGIDYDIHGNVVDVRALVEFFAEQENYSIEHLLHIDEGDLGRSSGTSSDNGESRSDSSGDPHLNVFVADLRTEQPMDGFTP